jgi:gamma-glutamyltranspeptidase
MAPGTGIWLNKISAGEAIVRELEVRGHRVRPMERGIGRLHGLSIDFGSEGPVRYLGGVDPRGRGLAKGL